MSDIQGKINVFIANMHPLILLLGIIKGFSDTTVQYLRSGFLESLVRQRVCVLVNVCTHYIWCVYTHTVCCLVVCGRSGDREGGYHS